MQPTQFFIWLPGIGSDKVAVVLERNGKADLRFVILPFQDWN
jgi:hypothetical protein